MRPTLKSLLVIAAALLFVRTSCETNIPPDAPAVLDGPSSGMADTSYTFVVTGTDPDGDSVAFRFDWGDGVISSWSAWQVSGSTCDFGHAWTDSGTYAVTALARDKYASSGPSAEHEIAIAANTPDYPWRVLTTITISEGAGAVAVQPGGGYVYVIPYDKPSNDDRVVVIRTADNVPVDSVTVGTYPLDLAFLPGGDFCYVSHDPYGEQDVWLMVIRTDEVVVVDTIDVPRWPAGMSALPDGDYLYVPCVIADSLVVVRTADNIVADSLLLSGASRAMAAPDGERVYVAGERAVYVVRAGDNVVTDSVRVEHSVDLALTADGSRLFVSAPDFGRVYAVRTSDNAVTDSATVGVLPGAMVLLPGDEYLYVVDEHSHSVLVIRTADLTVVREIAVGHEPNDIAVLPDGRALYVTCWSAPVHVIGF